MDISNTGSICGSEPLQGDLAPANMGNDSSNDTSNDTSSSTVASSSGINDQPTSMQSIGSGKSNPSEPIFDEDRDIFIERTEHNKNFSYSYLNQYSIKQQSQEKALDGRLKSIEFKCDPLLPSVPDFCLVLRKQLLPDILEEVKPHSIQVSSKVITHEERVDGDRTVISKDSHFYAQSNILNTSGLTTNPREDPVILEICDQLTNNGENAVSEGSGYNIHGIASFELFFMRKGRHVPCKIGKKMGGATFSIPDDTPGKSHLLNINLYY